MGRWRLQQSLTKETEPERGGRLVRIYADEDVEKWAVEYLRKRSVNIASVGERGQKGKEDPDVVAYAYQQKRSVLTRNRDFLKDTVMPFNRMCGLVVIDGKTTTHILDNVLFHIIPYFKYYGKMKTEVSASHLTRRYQLRGRVVTQYQFRGLDVYEWG